MSAKGLQETVREAIVSTREARELEDSIKNRRITRSSSSSVHYHHQIMMRCRGGGGPPDP